jgi:hypothetical protein
VGLCWGLCGWVTWGGRRGCEDLSDVTWEQLARKLGLVAEVRRRVVCGCS